MSQHGLTETAPVANLNDGDAQPAVFDVAAASVDSTSGPTLAEQLNALGIKAAVANRNKDRAVEEARAATAAVVATLGRGATQNATDPRSGHDIAQINVSKETFTARIVDRARAEEWLLANHPEKVEEKERITPGFEEAALAALREHAGFLLEKVKVIPDHVFRELELLSEKARQPMGWSHEIGEESTPPGIQVTSVAPRVKITYRDADLIDDLIERGVIDHEGNVLTGGA